ncbi:MAG TPA: hypothetical protein VKB03_14530 [Conexibacter sp.]|nr:hypothetical protein [Conexibacter sp.]
MPSRVSAPSARRPRSQSSRWFPKKSRTLDAGSTRRNEREYSFVDATSFAVMRRRRIREALAFDGDFSAAGFVELRP